MKFLEMEKRLNTLDTHQLNIRKGLHSQYLRLQNIQDKQVIFSEETEELKKLLSEVEIILSERIDELERKQP